jgi:hypothetical protein
MKMPHVAGAARREAFLDFSIWVRQVFGRYSEWRAI